MDDSEDGALKIVEEAEDEGRDLVKLNKENNELRRQILEVTERLNKLEKAEKPAAPSENNPKVENTKPKAKAIGKHRRTASLSPKRLAQARPQPSIWKRVQIPRGRFANYQQAPRREPQYQARDMEQVDRRREYGYNRSKSRPRQSQSAVDIRPRPPRRPAQAYDKLNRGGNKRSMCPFCLDIECMEPVECAMNMPWSQRMEAHRARRLCPDMLCFKTHYSRCTKPLIRCDFCGGQHHRIWCKTLAKRRNLA